MSHLRGRRAAFLAATCLSLSLAGNDLALAQGAPSPPAAIPTTDPANTATPPARVGRLAATSGSVSFHTANTDGWQDAVVNTPVTTGDAAFAQTGGRAELDVADSIVDLDSASELDVAALDDTHFETSEPQGRIFVDLGQQPAGSVTSVATPRGTVTFDGPGEFEIAAGDSGTPTVVTAVAGTAHVTAGTLALTVPAGSAATVTGTDQLAGNVAAAGPPDDFLHASLAAIARTNGHLPRVVAGMTGCQALATTGTWKPVAQYGEVWYPPVAASWVPYREGHWSYVAPWGWTWIDDAPWGFAPFHYGRWAYLDDRWGWIPGDPAYAQGYGGPEYDDEPEPVYAPALVTWGDFGAGLAFGAFAGGFFGGHRDRSVGWLPLGPGEAYVPPYGGGRAYFDRVNAFSVRDVRGIDPARAYAGRNFGQFGNSRGATVMAAGALQRGETVRGNGAGFPRAALAANPVAGRQVLGAPAAGTARVAAARGPAIEAANFHGGEGGRLGFRGGPAATTHGVVGAVPTRGLAGGAVPSGAAIRGAPVAPGGLPALRGHDAVLGGRPGAAPAIRADEPAGVPARAGDNHAGLVAGAAAGAVGAALAAHALDNRGIPARPGAPAAAPGRVAAFHGAPPAGAALRGAPTALRGDVARPGEPAFRAAAPGARGGAAPTAVRFAPPRAGSSARPPGGGGGARVITPSRSGDPRVHVITPSGGGGFRPAGPPAAAPRGFAGGGFRPPAEGGFRPPAGGGGGFRPPAGGGRPPAPAPAARPAPRR